MPEITNISGEDLQTPVPVPGRPPEVVPAGESVDVAEDEFRADQWPSDEWSIKGSHTAKHVPAAPTAPATRTWPKRSPRKHRSLLADARSSEGRG